MTWYVFFTLFALLSYIQAGIYLFFFQPRTKVNVLLIIVLCSLTWISVSYMLIHFSDTKSTVYLFDKIGSIGWIAFPWLWLLFLYHATNNQNKLIERLMLYLAAPLGAAFILGYFGYIDSIKTFYPNAAGIWCFDVNSRSVLFLLGLVFINSVILLMFFVFGKWYLNIRNEDSRKTKIYSQVLFVSLLVFLTLSFLSHIVMPVISGNSFPRIIHLAAFPMVAAVLFATVFLQPTRFLPEMIANLFIDRIREFILFVHPNGSIFSVNRYCLEKLDYTGNDMIGKDPFTFFNLSETTRNLIEGDDAISSEPVACEIIAINGDAIPVLLTVTPIHDAFRNISGYLFFASDHSGALMLKKEYNARLIVEKELLALNDELEKRIIEKTKLLSDTKEKMQEAAERQKESSEKLASQLREKEEMVREIHHRVKNNIQLLVSLLKIEQDKESVKSSVKKVYDNISLKVLEISAIHDYIYGQPYYGKINIRRFIHKIIDELKGRYFKREQVFFNVDVAIKEITVEQAIPSGIIAHELITNSFKYAFPELLNSPQKRSDFVPIIQIRYLFENGKYIFSVSDNGIGMSLVNGKPKNRQAGLIIIEALVEEYLNGNILFKAEKGTNVLIEFPALVMKQNI